MNLSKRQQLFGVVAVAAVALLAGDRLVFTPLARSLKARSERIAELKKSVAQGTLLLDREQSIRERWGNMRTNTLTGEASVAENQVLKAFDRWAQDSRVAINSIKPQWKRGADDYMTLECGVEAFGSLPALTRFLYDVEQDSLALKVSAVQITTRDDNGAQLTLGLQVNGLLLTPLKTR